MILHQRRLPLQCLAAARHLPHPASLPSPLRPQQPGICPSLQRRAFFEAARSLFGETPKPEPLSVLLLAGFLGAGKTTVLEQVLKEKHGFKLGVVVNDLASVNVDANVLKKSIAEAGVKSVQLENGCVCCTAAEDLRLSIGELGRDRSLDAVVVELSGVAEPARTKQLLETNGRSTWWRQDRPVTVRTVTVVDSPAFAEDYVREQGAPNEHKLGEHGENREHRERFGALLAEQVESADVVLLNKADVASQEQLAQARAVVRALNEVAETRVTEHGRVKVSQLLAAEPKALSAVPEPPEPRPVSACCAAKTCSKTNEESSTVCVDDLAEKEKPRAETRFGITSFVYTTEHMMSRSRLLEQLESWRLARESLGNTLSLEGLQRASGDEISGGSVGSPLAPVLRSKGILLLDSDPAVAHYWSHAGKSVKFSVFGPWPPNLPVEQGGFGAPRTELVFIGTGHDEQAIRQLLDSCLLTAAEQQLLQQRQAATASAPA